MSENAVKKFLDEHRIAAEKDYLKFVDTFVRTSDSDDHLDETL